MKARTMLLTLSLCLVGVAICFAQNAQIGTWKLNEDKVEAKHRGAKEHHRYLRGRG